MIGNGFVFRRFGFCGKKDSRFRWKFRAKSGSSVRRVWIRYEGCRKGRGWISISSSKSIFNKRKKN